MRHALITLCLLVAAPAWAETATAPTAAGVPAAKEHKIRELLSLTGADQMGPKMLSQLKMQLAPQQYEQLASVIHPDELVALLVPIYAKHFTDQDLDGLLVFYRGPLGKKLVSEMEGIAAESAVVGQGYARTKVIQMQGTRSDVPPADKK